MHSKLDRLENNKDFIDWLKEQGCSSQIINEILEFNDLSVFKKRVIKQPDLLTALVKNGYDSKVVNTAFCYGNDQMYNNFLGYKPFVLKLLKNQCPADSLQMLYCSNSYDYGDKISQYHEVYITLFKYFPRLKNSCIFNNVVAGLLNCDEPNLNKLRSNIQLFSLLVTNGLSCDIFSTLVTTEDFKNLKINGNKELLDFLLNNQLITFDEDKLNFIRNYRLVSSFLKTDDLTVADLQDKGIKEIYEKADELSRSKINSSREQLKLPKDIGKKIKLTYDDGVCSLQTFVTAVIIDNMKKEKLSGPSLSSVETECAETSRCVIS